MASGTITSLGIGSDLDLQGIIDSLREADETSITLKETEISELESQQDEFDVINAQLLSMKTTALNLTLESSFLERDVSVSSSGVLTATATDGAATGTWSVDVERLARQSSFLSGGKDLSTASVYVPTVQKSSQGFEDTDSTVVLESGEEMSLTYGSEDARQVITITGTDGGMTLEELADAINSAGGTYVTAEAVQDEDGLYYLQISATSGGSGEENRVSVTVPPDATGFSAPDAVFSYTLGDDGEEISLDVSADTTLEDLVDLINDDENNPGITASLVNTGNAETPYKLLLKSDETGEDARIRITSGLDDLEMTEQNGAGSTMTADTAVSFDSPVVITAAMGNNSFVFQEDTGDGLGATLTATIADGVFSDGDALAAAVEAALEEASLENGAGADYQVSYQSDTGLLSIRESGSLESLSIQWADEDSTAAATLGFSENQTITPADGALNASVTIDGVTYQRQSNSDLTDLVSGVTLSLSSAGSTSISITANTATVSDGIKTLVEELNTLLDEIDANDDYDEDTETWGTLARSSSARSIRTELISIFSLYSDTGTEISSLFDLGLEIDSDGTITLDEETLAEQISSNFEGIQALLLGTDDDEEDGLAEQLNSKISAYTLSSGIIESETDAIDEKITRLEETIEAETERLEKRYETLTAQFVELDSYMSEMESQQNAISQIFEATSE